MWVKYESGSSLVFGLDLKCLVLWQLLLLTCAAPTHAQKYLGKNTFIYLFVSPIDAGSQKCTQGTPSVKGRKKYYLKWVNWYLRSGRKFYANICGMCRICLDAALKNLEKKDAELIRIRGQRCYRKWWDVLPKISVCTEVPGAACWDLATSQPCFNCWTI